MAGSQAEERIRAKAEASLRRAFPDARIIHELVLQQGGCRIDLAAVTPTQIVLGEIKSERDVLKRLADQLAAAFAVTEDVRLYVADKHVKAVEALEDYHTAVPRDPPVQNVYSGRLITTQLIDNPSRIPLLSRTHLIREDGEAGDLVPFEKHRVSSFGAMPHPKAIFDLLWAAEQEAVVRSLGFGRATRDVMSRFVVENLSGSEIRRHVCAALRARPFPRSDPAIEIPDRRLIIQPNLYRAAERAA
jgi:hypothetical protein